VPVASTPASNSPSASTAGDPSGSASAADSGSNPLALWAKKRKAGGGR
jgi:hypothetical protein